MYSKIYYVNLDSRPDRLEKFENGVINNLPSLKSKFKRVSATDMTMHKLIGQRGSGCSLSHLRIWRDIVKNNYSSAIILEDDLKLIVTEDVFNYRIQQLYERYPDFGVCNISWRNMMPLNPIDDIFSIGGSIQTTSGYIISKEYAELMQPRLEESIENLLKGEAYGANAIDIIWKEFQGNKKWLVMDRIGIQGESFSDIELRPTDYGV